MPLQSNRPKNRGVLLFLISVFLIIVGPFFFYSYKQKQTEFLIKKNRECDNLAEKIEKNILTSYQWAYQWTDEWSDEETRIDYSSKPKLIEVFYSKERNSCLYYIRQRVKQSFCDSDTKSEYRCESYGFGQVFDYSSGERLIDSFSAGDFFYFCHMAGSKKIWFVNWNAMKLKCGKDFFDVLDELRHS
jgi:hypothetical protein